MPTQDFKFEIVKNFGTLSESTKGWKKELNIVSWNGGKPKYDIRDWSPEHDKMGKGITLNDEEIQLLKDFLKNID
ncbi:MAG: YdbC family protein [Phascolarctobacterium sp.]|nr:YdbC family protein [Candidatus Phascolarctobacterium caballi]MCQ2381672.1 YdbC family protein [Acidaminococcaceae bacterium]